MSHSLSPDELATLRSTIRGTLERADNADRALAEIGVEDLIEAGGSALAVCLEELGRAGATHSMTDRIALHSLGLDDDSLRVVYPMPWRGVMRPPTVMVEGSTAEVSGLLRGAAVAPGSQVLLATVTGEPFTVPASALTIDQVAAFDPTGGWQRVRGQVRTDELATPGPLSPASASSVIRRALSSELLGTAREITRMAVEHVTVREQFGRPLGSLQSVRHRLAEAHIDVSAAASVIELAWAHPQDNEAAIAAKAWAGRSYESSSAHAMQVCGAMGLTEEFPLHGLVRHGGMLNTLMGDVTELTAHLGEILLGGTSLPTPDPLALEETR